MEKETELSARQIQLSEPLIQGDDPLPEHANMVYEPQNKDLSFHSIPALSDYSNVSSDQTAFKAIGSIADHQDKEDRELLILNDIKDMKIENPQ